MHGGVEVRGEINLLLTCPLGLGDGDIDLATSLLQKCLDRFPKGALFLFFAGRIEEIQGNIEEVGIAVVVRGVID
jgi:hypothetical protein